MPAEAFVLPRPAAAGPFRLANPRPAEATFTPTPRVVGIQITARCQLRCRHCFNHSGPERLEELPLAVIEGVLDEVRRWGVGEVRLSGGEPTCHRRFRDVVEACRRRRLRIALNTHGVYAPRLLEWATAAPIHLFLVSVDGLEQANDGLRGRGTFARAMETCRRLHEAGQRVILAFHAGAANCGDAVPLAREAAEMGVGFKLAPLRPLGRALEPPQPLIEPRRYREIVGELVALRRRFPHLPILTDFDVLDPEAPGPGTPDPWRGSCKAGREMININYDGEIYPCAFFATRGRELSGGSVYRQSLLEVWRCSPVFEPLRRHAKSERCRRCSHYRRRCAGGCPAIAHWSTGTLDAHDPTCFAGLAGEGAPG